MKAKCEVCLESNLTLLNRMWYEWLPLEMYFQGLSNDVKNVSIEQEMQPKKPVKDWGRLPQK